MPVDRQRRIGLVRLQHLIDRDARRDERRIVQRPLRKRRREARRHQQHVALAQRHVEPLGEPQHHVARRRGPAGFDEGQVPRGNLRVERKIQLTKPAALPPLPQVITDAHRLRAGGSLGRGDRGVHGRKASMQPARLP
jgi:hypothetical protein